MTKKEYQQRFAKEAAALVSNPHYHITLDVAREECPYVGPGGIDATSIIRNEGRIVGWMECLRFLKSISKSEPEPSAPKPAPLYPDPDKRKSDQNQK
jgi:hypothetical protein